MADDVVKRMKARVAQCRRLADATTDERAANILRQMADEGEADIKRIELAPEG
jgi:3-deoxy-D-arabino-heptulosonate 7-phosphate (DAHP) synthase class II